ncbi:MAG: hypothetical protein PHP06_05890 [Clostridia bacterium]|nr:hypothetical protein [Clostridia bacterium]
MKLSAKCHPDYFAMLDIKTVEFRQFESIVLENTETGEIREFLIKDVRKIYPGTEETIKTKYPKVPWDPDLPVFAIDLGDELDRNDIPVPQKVYATEEAKEAWHGGVGE